MAKAWILSHVLAVLSVGVSPNRPDFTARYRENGTGQEFARSKKSMITGIAKRAIKTI